MKWRVGGGNGEKGNERRLKWRGKGGERGGIGVMRRSKIRLLGIVVVLFSYTSYAILCHVMSCNMI